MQTEITKDMSGVPAHAPAALSTGLAELWRGAWVIYRKHMHKFVRNGTELGGTLAAPLLLAMTFGAGMQKIVAPAAIGGGDYLSFITPGILGFTALSGAVNAGMTILEEKIRGYLKQYLVAPIPRTSVLLASTLSGLVKTLVQSLLILLIALLFGARLQTSPAGVLGALLVLALFMLAIVGFANGVALRSKSIGGYHIMLFLLNLPLLFLSNAFYPLDAMPLWMRLVAYLNPTTYVVDGLRLTLFGSGDLPLAVSVLVLGAFAALLQWYGVQSFRRVV
jgi:ABC-2 type transport system permease protein